MESRAGWARGLGETGVGLVVRGRPEPRRPERPSRGAPRLVTGWAWDLGRPRSPGWRVGGDSRRRRVGPGGEEEGPRGGGGEGGRPAPGGTFGRRRRSERRRRGRGDLTWTSGAPGGPGGGREEAPGCAGRPGPGEAEQRGAGTRAGPPQLRMGPAPWAR